MGVFFFPVQCKIQVSFGSSSREILASLCSPDLILKYSTELPGCKEVFINVLIKNRGMDHVVVSHGNS